MTDTDYTDDPALPANTPAQAGSLMHSLEQAAEGIGLYVNANKIHELCFKQKGAIFTLSGKSLKWVHKFTYLRSTIWPTESDVNVSLAASAWTTIDMISIIWKSNLPDKIRQGFFQATAVSALLHGGTRWTLTKHIERKLDRNYTKMLRAVLNNSWK